jgi:hypothetical protein
MKPITLLGSAVILFLTTLVSTNAQESPLTRAKELYEAASYSEALAALGLEGGSGDVVEAETYRALCFLALGQPKDAERALEQLVLAKPSATLDPASVSPRIVSIFDEVRRRTIATAAKEMYQRARTRFDQGDLEGAASQFEEVVTLAQYAPPERAELMEELKMLATGFGKLVENVRKQRETTAITGSGAQPASVPPPAETTISLVAPIAPAAGAAAAMVVAKPSSVSDEIFDASSPNVTPPSVIRRDMPRWPERAAVWRGSYNGILEVVVSETGTVIETSMLAPVHPLYDSSLRGATRDWRFVPATNDGRPVKYRLRYSITSRGPK